MYSPDNTTSAELKRARTEYNFRQKYGQEGFDKLMEMIESFERLDVIATRFEVTRPRISHVIRVLLEQPYNEFLSEHGIRRKKVTPRKENSK